MNANCMKDRTLVAVVAEGGVSYDGATSAEAGTPRPEPWSSWRRGGRLCPRCGVDHHLCPESEWEWDGSSTAAACGAAMAVERV